MQGFMVRLGTLPIPRALKKERAKRKRLILEEDHVASLQEARAQLTANVDDPLPEARAIAKKAHKKGGGNLYEPKASARRLEFSQDWEDDEDEIDEPLQLSAVPPMKTTIKTEQKPTSRPKSPGQKRRAWSTDERMAVKVGVEKFGVGRWVEIKDHYHDILKGRTNGMIKDCYRTMVRKGEIDGSKSKSK